MWITLQYTLQIGEYFNNIMVVLKRQLFYLFKLLLFILFWFTSRPSAIRGNFELDLEGDEIDDEDDEENGNLGVPSSAIRPTGKMLILPFHLHVWILSFIHCTNKMQQPINLVGRALMTFDKLHGRQNEYECNVILN